MPPLNTAIGRLRLVGWLEGCSFLLLLGVAMPLKYLAGQPMAVKIVGWGHGVLFMLYALALLQAMLTHRWSLLRAAGLMTAAIVPMGPFFADRELREDSEVEPTPPRAP